MQNFQQLDVWKRSHELVLKVYRTSTELPQSENFGLVLQLRRSATMIATRIAEGAGRPTNDEFAGELRRSRAAGYELEYLLLLTRDLGFLKIDEHHVLSSEIIEIRRMLSGLVKRVTASP
jgi:four helix bundle protein